MDSKADLANVGAASERFFRCYRAHCFSPNLDTLFFLLDAGHSLNDRLRRSARLNFFDIPEFTALKCLRNYFHHHEELRNVVRICPAAPQIVTDLIYLCLVPRESVVAAIEQTRGPSIKKREARRACEDVFHWYGQVVNINPALFNFVVAAYERLKETDVALTGKAVEEFENSYCCEKEKGLPHVVDGRLKTTAGSVDDVLRDIISTRFL